MTRLVRARWGAIGAVVAVALGGGGLIGVTAATPTATGGSVLTTVSPTRILDTRAGSPVSGATIAVQVTGSLVPAGASAVLVNLTVTGGVRTAGYGFVTAFPCTSLADPVPNASTLNFVEGVDIANSTTVPLGATGKMCLSVYGTAHLLVDVAGYYAGSPAVDAYTRAETEAAITDAVRDKANGSDLDALAGDVADGLALKADDTDLDALEADVATRVTLDDLEEAFTSLSQSVDESLAVLVDRVSGHLVPRLSPVSLTADYDLDRDVGLTPSIAIGRDGLPAIVHATSDGSVMFAKCADHICSSTMFSEIDPSSTDLYPTLAIGHDGNPVIAYGNGTELITVACNDPLCRGDDELRTAHGAIGGSGGFGAVITLLPNDWPIVVFIDQNDRLKVLSCSDQTCSGGTTTSPIPGQLVTAVPSVAVSPLGHPVITVGVQATSLRSELLAVSCNDAACDGADETTRVVHSDPTKEIGLFSAVAIGTDGFPIIAYFVGDPSTTSSSLYMYACDTHDCVPAPLTSGPSPLPIPSTERGGSYVSIAIGGDGNPVVAHVHSAYQVMEVIWCTETDCQGDLRRSDEVGNGSWPIWTSMAIGIDGVPIVAFHDLWEGELRTSRPWWMAGGRR